MFLILFRYGHLTWEWDKKIRSCVYPFIVHLLYKIVPDSTFFIASDKLFILFLFNKRFFLYMYISDMFSFLFFVNVYLKTF